MRGLWRRQPRTGFIKFLMFHTTMLCAMNAIWTGTSAYGVQITYVDNRNYPGGPFAFLMVESPLATNVLSNVGYTIGNVMADALLVSTFLRLPGSLSSGGVLRVIGHAFLVVALFSYLEGIHGSERDLLHDLPWDHASCITRSVP